VIPEKVSRSWIFIVEKCAARERVRGRQFTSPIAFYVSGEVKPVPVCANQVGGALQVSYPHRRESVVRVEQSGSADLFALACQTLDQFVDYG
jgi:hypothetical protein